MNGQWNPEENREWSVAISDPSRKSNRQTKEQDGSSSAAASSAESRQLYVSNFPHSTTKDELVQLFGQVSLVKYECYINKQQYRISSVWRTLRRTYSIEQSGKIQRLRICRVLHTGKFIEELEHNFNASTCNVVIYRPVLRQLLLLTRILWGIGICR
jgi:RNA recognition motif-containing protein